MAVTRCMNPKCRKMIPAIDLEFGGPRVLVNGAEILEFDNTMAFACSQACVVEARAAYLEEMRADLYNI